jgi:hypothetical protein
MKKKVIIIPALALALAVGWTAHGVNANGDDNNGHASGSLVGAWNVQAIGAPYEPHLFTFNSDGTMNSTNPTNVQESSGKPNGGTNDSLGMGPWKTLSGKANTYVGTFYELNANAADHTPTDTLSVTYKIVVKGDKFDGKALAKQGSFSAPAELKGTRLGIDTSALAGL